MFSLPNLFNLVGRPGAETAAGTLLTSRSSPFLCIIHSIPVLDYYIALALLCGHLIKHKIGQKVLS